MSTASYCGTYAVIKHFAAQLQCSLIIHSVYYLGYFRRLSVNIVSGML